MKNEIRGLEILLALWIKSDTALWRELEDGHIKLLHQRLVKKQSYSSIAKQTNLSEKQVRALFEAIVCIIERAYGYLLADFLREIDLSIESKVRSKSTSKAGIEVYRIWLN
ncbi:MAG: hypothetical protein Crog4KO_06640 [Crocinitomicaceae bacterium]